MAPLAATWFVFLLPCALVALGLALPRPRRWLVWAVLAAPALALVAAYADATLHQRGDKVTLEVHALRIGPARLAEIAPGQSRVLLVVGDRAEAADLVVPSAADPRQAEADLAITPRILMEVVGTRDAGGALALALRLTRVAPDPAIGLPGMEAVSEDGRAGEIALAQGDGVRVAINRIEPGGRRIERRVLAVTVTHDGLRIGLDSPLRATAGTCGLGGGAARLDLRLQPATSRSDVSTAFASPDRLAFDELGLGGAEPLLAPSLLGPVADPALVCGGEGAPFVWPAADGEADARLELIARVAQLDWFLPLFAAAAAFGLWWVAGRDWPQRRGEFAAVALAGLLLGYRLLFAIAAPHYDAALDPGAVPLEAVVGLLAVPIALVALLRGDGEREDWRALALLLAGGAGSLLLWRGAWPGLLVMWPLLAAGALLGWRWAGSPVPRPALPAWIARRSRFEQAALLVLAAIAIRFALALPPLSARERLAGIPLSVPYIAALIGGFAVMLHQLRTEAKGWRDTALVAGLALIATLAVPWWVRDSGFAFLAAPPLLALIALAAPRNCRPLAAAPLLLAPLALLGISAWLAANAADAAALPLFPRMQAMLGFSGNELRLIQFFDPDALGAVVTRQAYAAIEQQHLLGQLAAGLTGEGWLAPASLYSLRPVQLSDNAVAVHAMWPFGRLAAVGLLAVMAGLAVAAARGRAALPAFSTERFISWLASALLVWAMAYMICANLLLVPFIGRNIYLLSATSGGDLLEGTLLLAAALWPLRSKPV